MLKAVFGKRTVSLLLCMALLLSFMPTTSSVDLAEPEETAPAQESDLPEAIPALDGEDMEPAAPQALPPQPDVEPQTIPAGGVSGTWNSLTWTLTEDGKLTISGTGEMGYSSGAPWHAYDSEIKTAVISNGVTSIGEGAFFGCSSLTSVTIPNGVTNIGASAFNYCSSLTSVTIPNSVTSIGGSAFCYCSSLTSVSIPNSVTSIGGSTFSRCSSLISVTIPSSVTSIGTGAFSNCNSLTRVDITDIDAWCRIVFGDSSSNPLSIAHYLYLNNKLVKNVVIPSDVTELAYTFCGCSSLTSVTIPDSVTSIGNNTFYYCSSLTSVTIPNSVTSIGEGAFFGCSSLTSVTIPNGVTNIGASAFYYCSSLTSVTIPDSMTNIGASAFYGCSSLTSVTIPDSVTNIGEGAFFGCSSLTSVTIPDSVTNIGASAFYGCSSLTSVTIPNSVTSIGGSAFAYCYALTSVTIPNSVTSIGGSAFYYCSSLTSVTIPDSVASIGDYAFSNCSSLTSVTIPDNVTHIGQKTFNWCSSLTEVTIGAGVQIIAQNAFYGCSNIQNVYYRGTPDAWEEILIESGNDDLKNAVMHYITVFITQQPTSVRVANVGDTASTTVTVHGDGLSYQWYIKNPGATKFTKSSITKATYSTKVTEASNGRQLYCVITDQYGNSVQSDTVTFSIREQTAAPIVITGQPVSVQVEKAGDTASTTVTAIGEGLTYQWYIKNTTDTAFKASAIKKATYSTTVTEACNGRQLYCVVKDKNGNTAQTDTVTFTIKPSVKIVTQPKSVVVSKIGDTATATVTAQGEGLTYQWYIKNPADAEFKASAIRKATYSTTVTETSDGRELYCVVKDKYGNSVQTNTITFSVARVKIVTQPGNAVVEKIGDTVQTKVTASGEGLTYQWYLKNPGENGFKASSIRKATYSTTLTAAANGRELYCVVTDKYGNTAQTDTVTLTALPAGLLTLRLLPESVTAQNGTASFSISAMGDGITYAWYYKDAGQVNFYRDACTSAACAMTVISANDGRQVFCVITDANGNRVRSNTCTVNV